MFKNVSNLGSVLNKKNNKLLMEWDQLVYRTAIKIYVKVQ